jgi:hypothetical protein
LDPATAAGRSAFAERDLELGYRSPLLIDRELKSRRGVRWRVFSEVPLGER